MSTLGNQEIKAIGKVILFSIANTDEEARALLAAIMDHIAEAIRN